MATKITSRVIADDAIIRATLGDDAIGVNEIADDAISSAAIGDDVALGGNPTTTTQSTSNDTTRIATTAFVQAAIDTDINTLIDSAPGTLNTLNEIAAALNDDPSFTTTVNNAIALKAPIANPTFTGNATFDSPTLYVDGDNNRVGIGDTTPSYTLDVAGTLRATGTITGDITGAVTGNASTATALATARTIGGTSFDGTANIAVATATTAGTVSTAAQPSITSVGTLTSLAITGDLDIADTAAGAITVGGTTNAYNAPVVINATDLGLAISDGTKTLAMWGVHGGGSHSGSAVGTRSNHDLALITNDAKRMVVNAAGYVGIGTTSPEHRVHIVDGSAGSVTASGDKDTLVLENSTHGGMSVLTPDAAEAGIFTGHPSAARCGEFHTRFDTRMLRIGTRGHNDFETQFYTGNWSEAMRLDAGGNLGIGTNDPSAKLHLYTAGSGGINLGIQNSQRYWKIETVSEKLNIADVSAGGAVRMAFDTSGNVTKPSSSCFSGARNGGHVTDDQVFIGDTAHTNIGSDYATGNGRYTAPVAGNYFIYADFTSTDSGSSATQNWWAIRNNGSIIRKFLSHKTGAYHHKISGTAIITLAANDYIEWYVGESGTTGGWVGSQWIFNNMGAVLLG